VASGVLAVLVGAAFAVLLGAIAEQRDSGRQASHSRLAQATADGLEKLVIDLETGVRGFVITRRDRFLEPWRAARTAFPAQAARLVALAEDPGQARRARQITQAVTAYIREYSVPLVNAARRNEPYPRSTAATDEGKRRVDAMREEFDRFATAERVLLATRQERADVDARRATIVATAGLAGSMLVIALFGGYLTRAIAVPIRRAAAMADRLAGGDLATRMPESAVGEIGGLERAFNTMGRSLEASRDELRLLADEHAAFGRVATLVARGVPASELLDAVAGEVHRLLAPDFTCVLRYEADGSAAAVADRAGPGVDIPHGAHYTLEGENIVESVSRTGVPARMGIDEGARGSIASVLREQGLRCSVAAPIVVVGRLWGVMVAVWKHDNAPSADSEEQLAQFSELVAVAIANANARAEVAASRARLVATADETRRRVVRDLHDGAQQRLVHTVVTLKLARHALEQQDPAVGALIGEALEHAEGANSELRELAHGILPAVLTRGGLRPAVAALVSRMPVPVTVDIPIERLPSEIEAPAYFVIAEALTNVAKHSGARSAEVSASLDDGVLHVEVHDDGVGGATRDGSGMLGLSDRLAALDGTLDVESPKDGGTLISATIPVSDYAGDPLR
jgi:signal transduction histidine kinase